VQGLLNSWFARAIAIVVVFVGAAIGVELAVGDTTPLNDLFAIGQGGGDTPDAVQVVKRAEPPFAATPLVACGPGSHPQPGIDGRVPAGSATNGLSCNVSLVGHQGTEGGFKVFRYFDTHGHECAFYDTTLLFPTNAFNPGGGSAGVAVLDMSDPSHPVQTATLTELAMLTPHESLNLNAKRGLLAAVAGNPATAPGFFAVYDVHDDCRHPVLDASGPWARWGHESGFSADGKTFYATSTALQAITAIDLTDPKHPQDVWQGNVKSHGMSLSDDGNRAYIADPGGQLLILDTSQIQARKPQPHAREISRLTWTAASIPQNAIPFNENGHPYLLETDEYNQRTTNPSGDADMVGAARIIDISDETKPAVAANLRLAVNQPAAHKAASADPGATSPVQGYAAHYCNVPYEDNPKIVACAFIASGLRVFDISDIEHPKEIGYYVVPSHKSFQNGEDGSDFVMSKPAFAPERHEIWFSDGGTGFYVVRVDPSVWPGDGSTSSAGTVGGPVARCGVRSRFLVKVHVPRGARLRSVQATLGGKRVRVVRRGRSRYVSVNLSKLTGSSARLVIRVHLVGGRTLKTSRVYRLCGR
jgi:hypothetical protein